MCTVYTLSLLESFTYVILIMYVCVYAYVCVCVCLYIYVYATFMNIVILKLIRSFNLYRLLELELIPRRNDTDE